MYYVYVLKSKIGEGFYIGYTENLQRRLKQHQRNQQIKLLYYESYLSSKTARDREKKLKYYGSAWRALRKRITA